MRCGREIRRGELVWLRKPDDGSWLVTCGDCEPVDHSSERAAQARLKALSKDDDPESLLEAIIRYSPTDIREELEDDLGLVEHPAHV